MLVSARGLDLEGPRWDSVARQMIVFHRGVDDGEGEVESAHQKSGLSQQHDAVVARSDSAGRQHHLGVPPPPSARRRLQSDLV